MVSFDVRLKKKKKKGIFFPPRRLSFIFWGDVSYLVSSPSGIEFDSMEEFVGQHRGSGISAER